MTVVSDGWASLIEQAPSWARAAKMLSDGRMAAVVRMIFTWKLVVGPADSPVYEDGWCYQTEHGAIQALADWDGRGEPVGWHRHPPSGRRRPDGDASREYVNF